MAASGSRQRREAADELGPLPGGHHGLSREQVTESQRERLLAAIAQVVAERGYRDSTITEIVKVASVSSRGFYENFESKEQCFLAAFETVLAHLEGLIAEAVAPIVDWPHRVVTAIRTVVGFFAAESDLARFCLVETLTATPSIAIRFREAVVSAIPYLEPGRAERLDDGAGLPDSTEDSLIGGAVFFASRSILAGDPLPDLLPDLVDFVLSPYVGPEEAKRLASEAAEDSS